MVNPDAVITLPGPGLIIPVAVLGPMRVNGTDGVCITQIEQAEKGGPAVRMPKRITCPSGRVISINFLRNDIIVPGQYHRRFRGQ